MSGFLPRLPRGARDTSSSLTVPWPVIDPGYPWKSSPKGSQKMSTTGVAPGPELLLPVPAAGAASCPPD
eukprot:224589-Heterocapsa_arctica.AAC.1